MDTPFDNLISQSVSYFSQDINALLQQSMRVQMGTVRDTEFSDFVLSDACISTAGLMFVYLRALGIESRQDLQRF